ncbi:MAG: hypothetical protein ABIA74_03110 [bacterium]
MKFSFKLMKTAKFQLTAIIIAIFYVVGLLLWQNFSTFYAEEIFTLNKVEKATKKLANNVTVGLYINNFPSFDFDKNQFIMDAFLSFRFEVGTESIDTISKFSFRNTNLQNLGVLYQSEPMIKLIGDDVMISYHIQVEFKAPLEQKYFPIGDHRLNIILENRSTSPNELIFNSSLDDFVLSKDLFVSIWQPKQKMVQSGYLISKLNEKDPSLNIKYPAVVFTIDFENISNRNLYTLYFPMFVIFLIGLLSLTIEIAEISRLALVAASLPILVLFRTAIDAISPEVGKITKVDFVYFLLVFLSLLILLFQAFITLNLKKIKKLDEETQKRKITRMENLNNLFFIIIILLLVAAITYDTFVR